MKLRSLLIAGAAVSLLSTSGCAANAGLSTGGSSSTSSATLAETEISAIETSNAFSVVQQLRPSWLRVRGASSIYRNVPIRVYVDGVPMGSVQHLRQISASTVRRMEFLDGREATQRYGTDHANGVILVHTM